jgi:hypothetical protein
LSSDFRARHATTTVARRENIIMVKRLKAAAAANGMTEEIHIDLLKDA